MATPVAPTAPQPPAGSSSVWASAATTTTAVVTGASTHTSSVPNDALGAFTVFRNSLDQHHDRRERIVKISRDITNISKKMIFTLHRIDPQSVGSLPLPPLPPSSLSAALSNAQNAEATTTTTTSFSARTTFASAPAMTPEMAEILKEFYEKQASALDLFKRLSRDLQGPNLHRYQRSYSPAIQEYVEAMTFGYYVQYGGLMNKQQIEADLVFMIDPNQDLALEATSNNGPSLGEGGGYIGGGGGGRGRYKKRGFESDGRQQRAAKRTADNNSNNNSRTEMAAQSMTSQLPPTETAISLETDVVMTPSSSLASSETSIATLIQTQLELTDEDYILGIADLTGELMRLAINSLANPPRISADSVATTSSAAQAVTEATTTLTDQTATSHSASKVHTVAVSEGGPRRGYSAAKTPLSAVRPSTKATEILHFLRRVKDQCDHLLFSLSPHMVKKMDVMRQSLNKVEMACYSLCVRGAEYPPESIQSLLNAGGVDDRGGPGGGGGGGGEED